MLENSGAESHIAAGIDASLQRVFDVLQQRVIAKLNNQLVVANNLADAVIGHLGEHFSLSEASVCRPNMVLASVVDHLGEHFLPSSTSRRPSYMASVKSITFDYIFYY